MSLITAQNTSDPNFIPTVFVDGVSVATIVGGLPHFEFVTNHAARTDDGKVEDRFIVVARLRFDLQIARFLRDEIDKQIALVAQPHGHAN